VLYVVKGVISGYTSCAQAFQKQSMKDPVMIQMRINGFAQFVVAIQIYYECESTEHRQARLARKCQRTREETEEEREDRLAR